MDAWGLVLLLIAAGLIWWLVKTPTQQGLFGAIGGAIGGAATKAAKGAASGLAKGVIDSATVGITRPVSTGWLQWMSKNL